MPRVNPAIPGGVPEVADLFQAIKATRRFITNSRRILQCKPAIVRALRGLGAAVMDPRGEVQLGLKRLPAYAVSRMHGWAPVRHGR